MSICLISFSCLIALAIIKLVQELDVTVDYSDPSHCKSEAESSRLAWPVQQNPIRKRRKEGERRIEEKAGRE